MRIIVRSDGERTRNECIRRCRLEGRVEVIEGLSPFVEVLKATYELASTYDEDWIPVVDGDVLLEEGTLSAGMEALRGREGVFCLDGKTDDKVLMKPRRAGIHLYRRDLLTLALRLVEDSIKPETRVREAMASRYGMKTYIGDVVFGRHDYEQYYRDLWRKSYLQTQKLRRKVTGCPPKWKKLGKSDDDYRVILEGHRQGMRDTGKLHFDVRETYGAEEGLRRLKLREKGPLK